MTTSNKNLALSILSTLATETQEVLAAHFRQQVASEIAGTLTTKIAAKPANKTAKKPTEKKPTENKEGKRMINRQKTNDGTERSASQFIRDCDSSLNAKQVCEAGKVLGLEIEPVLVYNVRKQAAGKVEKPAKTPKTPKEPKVVDPNAPKRSRGRPAGSKNKPKLTVDVGDAPVETEVAEATANPEGEVETITTETEVAPEVVETVAE
jgi:hypothetical protein